MAATYSALTSDVQRDPSILHGMQLEAWAASPLSEITTTEHHGVTTVTAVDS
jgi:hypothetical protein